MERPQPIRYFISKTKNTNKITRKREKQNDEVICN